MSEDQPSNWELSRKIADVGTDVDKLNHSIERLNQDITRRLDLLVPREVFQLQIQQLADRVTAAEVRQKETDEERKTVKRWALGLIAGPVVSILLTIIFQIKGVG